jgi:hypothetical protein
MDYVMDDVTVGTWTGPGSGNVMVVMHVEIAMALMHVGHVWGHPTWSVLASWETLLAPMSGLVEDKCRDQNRRFDITFGGYDIFAGQHSVH